MAVNDDFLNYTLDQLAAFGKVTARKMFGGAGLYFQGHFFAILDDDVVYFKVAESNRAEYLARGCEPFRPYPGKDYAMQGYYNLPSEILEDPDALKLWAAKSVAIAAASKTKPRRAKAKK